MSSPGSGGAALDDPFRLGWRYIREVGTDGQETYRQVPLTERDLLFPQEGDFVVQRDAHTRDVLYLREALRIVLRERPNVRVFADHRIDFNLAEVEPLGPDVAVIDELPHWDRQRGTVRLAEEGCPLIVIEVTSPDTRRNDFGIKRGYYEAAKVPFYLIVDYSGENGPELIAWRYQNEAYHPIRADILGRVWFARLGFSVGVEAGEVWVYRRGGQRIGEAPELQALLDQARRELQAATEREESFEAEMSAEIDQRHQAQREATQERETRRQAEERTAQEAAARRKAEDRVHQEAEARRQAEERAAQAEQLAVREAETRRRLEERLAELERQLLGREGTPPE